MSESSCVGSLMPKRVRLKLSGSKELISPILSKDSSDLVANTLYISSMASSSDKPASYWSAAIASVP